MELFHHYIVYFECNEIVVVANKISVCLRKPTKEQSYLAVGAAAAATSPANGRVNLLNSRKHSMLTKSLDRVTSPLTVNFLCDAESRKKTPKKTSLIYV